MDEHGYGYLRLADSKSPDIAHRVMYQEYYQRSLTPDVVIRHSCDNPSCINPHHLLEGTQADNVKDMWDRRRQQGYENAAKGSRNGNAKIDEAMAVAIHQAEGSNKGIADQFDVHISIVDAIKCGRNWSHVTKAPRTSRPIGEENHASKLTEDQVRAIVCARGSLQDIADEHKVSRQTVHSIRTGKVWKHVTI